MNVFSPCWRLRASPSTQGFDDLRLSLGALFGLCFRNHQVGAFLGAWLRVAARGWAAICSI
jgi:hypothetical protein